MGRGRRPLRLVLSLALPAVLGIATACVDGVTPDCGDAAAQCGPFVDGAVTADAAKDGALDAPALDAVVPDAAEAGDLDAGDEV
jgi:hypothetical protein